jgi:hypothetical protein
MVCITSIATHDSGKLERLGLRRALLSRRANLGDCTDAPSLFRRLFSSGHAACPACVFPMPRRWRGQLSTADLAVRVSRKALCNDVGPESNRLGAIIYCHGAPDERIPDSTAARVQFDLGLSRAIPFAVSQAHNTSLLIALDMAAGLLEGPEEVQAALVVAADNLLFHKPPHPSRDMVWSEVAAAAVLERDASHGWRLLHVVLRQFPTPLDANQDWPADQQWAFAEFAAETIQSCLADVGLKTRHLAAAIATSPDPGFERQVHLRLGVRAFAGLPQALGLRATHTSCADLLIRLSQLESAAGLFGYVLAWCHGNNGEFACAVMTRIT